MLSRNNENVDGMHLQCSCFYMGAVRFHAHTHTHSAYRFEGNHFYQSAPTVLVPVSARFAMLARSGALVYKVPILCYHIGTQGPNWGVSNILHTLSLKHLIMSSFDKKRRRSTEDSGGSDCHHQKRLVFGGVAQKVNRAPPRALHNGIEMSYSANNFCFCVRVRAWQEQ
jgi:hypothetical protein